MFDAAGVMVGSAVGKPPLLGLFQIVVLVIPRGSSTAGRAAFAQS
jgi:hypothetical protein